MKHEKLFSGLWAVLLAVGLALSGAGCVVTAFELQTASLGAIALWVSVWAAAFALACTWKKGLIPGGILALLMGFGWVEGTLFYSLELLLRQISVYYSQAYGWPVVQLSDGLHPAGTVTWALCVLGTVTAGLVCRTVCGRKSSVLAVLWALLPLGACLVVTDKAPASGWLFVFLLFLGLLVLTQTLRRRAPAQANRLTALALVPAMLAMSLLYVLVPRAQYDKQALADRFVKDWEQLWEEEDPGKLLSVGGGAVSLSSLGSRSQSLRPVLDVTWDRGGTLYLRTCAYDTYYNNTWTNLAVPNSLAWPGEELLEDGGHLEIQTRYTLDLRAFPYYPAGDVLEDVNRGISNFSGKREYEYDVQLLRWDYPQYEDPSSEPQLAYTQLSTGAYTWGKRTVQALVEQDMPVSQKAQIIAQAVSECASYSLKTEKMPSDAGDFAQWFYEQSETGYCVHYATTAAVLLRAAEIPARYVTGYLVTVQAGIRTTVTEENAHAWVEYWLPGVGWVPLEATPASPLAEQIQPPETEQTVPPETAPTEPVQTPEQPEENPEPGLALGWLWIPAALLGAVAAAVLQWRLRVYLGRKGRAQGGINRRGIQAWITLTRFMAFLDESPPQELFALAQKAKFSHHALTREELEQMESAVGQAEKKLRAHPWYRQFYYRLILALY